MRLSLYPIVLLLMLVNASFAQSVWDNYRTTGSYGANQSESVQSKNVEQTTQVDEDNLNKPENRKITYIQNQKQWYIGDYIATPGAVEALLKAHPDAAVEVSKAKSYFMWGMLCAGIGGAAMGYGLAEWSEGKKKYTKPITFSGIAVASAGLVLANLSWGRTRAAVEIYNKSLGYNPSMYLSVVPTEQGGLALALAF